MNSPYQKSVQYISPLPEGYTQMAASIGNSYSRAISGIGESIGNAIKQYAQNKEERDFLDQKFEMAASVLDKYKASPELAQDPRVEKLVDGIGKFSSMSNTQKKAFLNNAEFAISQFDKEEQRKYQREQDQMKMDLAKQQALFEAARLQNENARLQNDTTMTNARIAEMNKTFTPSGSMVTLPDGTKIPMVMTSPNSAQPVMPKAGAGPESPVGKLLADRDARIVAGDQAGAAAIQKAIDAEKSKPLTADQANALNFSLRLQQNENFISKNKYEPQAFFNGSWTPERLQSDQKKAYDAAKNNWIAAALRKESGAAISATEYADFDKQYFPQPGDGADVLMQKQAMRAQVAKAMQTAIGPEADKYMEQARYVEQPQVTTSPGKTPKGRSYTVERLK